MCVFPPRKDICYYGYRTHSWPISTWIIVLSAEQSFAPLVISINLTERLGTVLIANDKSTRNVYTRYDREFAWQDRHQTIVLMTRVGTLLEQ